ncbi:unnamed protein product [Fraxinus pennsylvanica]|uniref:UspA domain-containing protein n=1 Tax=Fraxinus pennsylvanica TaxID=56036 RepID=A0AAD2DUS8_9LAMI|nr:unnamed protein product [Fraxinus pennsylvanica]
MDARKIVVVVEGVDAARTALQWALHNILRFGDLITLLHIYTTATSKSKKKLKLLLLKGFQMALSFREYAIPSSIQRLRLLGGDSIVGGEKWWSAVAANGV